MTKRQPYSTSDAELRDALTRSPDSVHVSTSLTGIVAVVRRTPQRRDPIPTWALIAAAIGLLLVLLFAAVVAQSRPARLTLGSIALDEGYDVVLINPDGSGRRSITTGPDTEWQPLFSPDGTWLAYWQADPIPAGDTCGTCVFGTRRLMIADLHDPNAISFRVLAEVTNDAPSTATWSPDSRYLAIAEVENAVRVIARIDVETGARTQIGPADLDGWDPAWAPDGSTIAFVRNHNIASQRGAYVMATDGSGLRQLNKRPSRGSGFSGLSWSPNGTEITFANETGGADPFEKDIWTVGLDEEPEVDISNDPADEFDPTWSLDGRRIAYLRQTSPPSALAHVIVSSADGTNQVALPESVTSFSPTWSSDGDHILVVEPASGPDGQPHVVLIDSHTGDSVLLAVGAPSGSASFLSRSR